MEWIAISGIVIWLGFCWMAGRDRGTSLPLVSSQVIDYGQETAVSPTVDANFEMLSAYWDQQKKKIAEIS